MANTAPVSARIETDPQKLPDINHFSTKDIIKAEFDAELQKGVVSINNGRTHSAEDIDRMLAEEFGI